MRNLLRILYVSDAAPGLGPQQIADILGKSAANNKAKGITGVLCYRGGHFAQILEGEELAVLALYLKISQDPRHTNSVIISISTTTRQMFEAWAMGGIAEDSAPFMKIEDILKFRNSGVESTDAVVMMQRWLALLESQSRPGAQ